MKANGIWTVEEAIREHCFSLEFAKALSEVLDKDWIVNDLGAGVGFYAQFLQNRGFDVFAYEGTPDIDQISIFQKPIIYQNLAKPTILLDHGQTICLEVGEHISAENQETVLDNIFYTTETRAVVSWGIPGQAGFGHVNCKSNEWVITEAKKRGFELQKEPTEHLRANCYHVGWFEKSVMVFDKKISND